MRQYQPIWESIKRNKVASLVAPIANHPRIIKAVTKEKYIDEGYKFTLAEKGLKSKLIVTRHNKNKQMITFTLNISTNLSVIGIHDL